MIHLRRALLFTALSLANLFVIYSPDALPASLFAWTVIREGNVDYDEFTATYDRELYFFRACGTSTATAPSRKPRSPGGPRQPGPNDHVCSIFPPGAAILAFPFFAPFVLAGAPPDEFLLAGLGKLVASLEEALAAVLLIAAARQITTPRWAFAIGLLYLLGTSVRTISSQALWQHGAAHLLLAASLFVLVRLFVGARVSGSALFGAGFALGFAVVVRQTSLVFAFAALAAILLARRPAHSFAAGALVGVLPLLGYDLIAFGDPLEQGYGAKPFDTPPLQGLYGLLLSPSRGLFIYSPFLLFALPPLVRAWRSRATIAPLLRWLGVASVVLLGGYVLYTEWWGGRVFGARFLSDAFPVLMLALAAGSPARGAARWLFGIAAAWSLLLHTAGALAYDPNGPTEINLNFDPAPLLSWSDPQWLVVLSALARPDPRVLVALALSLALFGVLLFTERDELQLKSR